AYTFTVTPVGVPTPAITKSGTLPPGVTFQANNDGTATLAGTPSAGAGGIYPLVFTATNGIAPTATQSFTLTVNQAPAIGSASGVTFTTAISASFAITTTGYPTATVARGGSLPTGVSFTPNANGTGTLAGAPAAGTGGVY